MHTRKFSDECQMQMEYMDRIAHSATIGADSDGKRMFA